MKCKTLLFLAMCVILAGCRPSIDKSIIGTWQMTLDPLGNTNLIDTLTLQSDGKFMTHRGDAFTGTGIFQVRGDVLLTQDTVTGFSLQRKIVFIGEKLQLIKDFDHPNRTPMLFEYRKIK